MYLFPKFFCPLGLSFASLIRMTPPKLIRISENLLYIHTRQGDGLGARKEYELMKLVKNILHRQLWYCHFFTCKPTRAWCWQPSLVLNPMSRISPTSTSPKHPHCVEHIVCVFVCMYVVHVRVFACNFRTACLMQGNRINITGWNARRSGQKHPVHRLDFQEVPFDMLPTINLIRPAGVPPCPF
jgi:hypothetical protein